MRDLDRRLKRGGRLDVSGSATAAATVFANAAADTGLLDVAYTTLDLPVGEVVVAATPRGLCRLSFATVSTEDVLHELAARISPRVIEAPSYFDGVRSELEEYFAGTRTDFDLPLDWTLTGGFTRKVLKRTAKIPYGAVSNYRDIAAAAGSPRGARAAGNALGANPLAIVVPCHRVLHSSGGLGGYGGGLERKQLLLELEGAIDSLK